MSTVTKTIELAADDDDSLLNKDESDTQTERAAMVPSSISAGDRDEVEKSRPNAVIYIDPVIGSSGPTTLDNNGDRKENTPLNAENRNNDDILIDLDFPEPELTFKKTELSEIHAEVVEDEPDNAIMTAESDKSQNWRPKTVMLVDAVKGVFNGNKDVTETESKEIKKESDDVSFATVRICVKTRELQDGILLMMHESEIHKEPEFEVNPKRT